MGDLIQDIRYGVRLMTANPGFAAVAALSLALGIGANTTIFTVVNAVFLSPLPIRDMSSLAMVFTTDSKQARGPMGNLMQVSYPNFVDFRDQNGVFEQLAAFAFIGGTLNTVDGPRAVQGFMVSGNYFDTLGVKAAEGRTFSPDEDRTPGAHPVMVISHGLWQRQFGGDRSVIGRTLRFNGLPFTIIGVAPEQFKGTIQGFPGDLIWVPAMMYPQILPQEIRTWPESRRALMMSVFGRLKQGVSVRQADAALKTIAAGLESTYPEANDSRSASVTRFTPFFNPANESQLVLIFSLMMAVVAVVLLIACINVANLLMARASRREREIGLRLAVGAGRIRLIRQLLTESTLLALAGGVLGLLLAAWGRQALLQIRPPGMPDDALALRLDPTVLGFTVAVSLLTGLLFGLYPALQSSRLNLTETLYEGPRAGTPGRRHHLIRKILVAAEIGLAVPALIVAGLFIRSMQAAQEVNPGFETTRLAFMTVDPAGAGYTQPQTEQFYRLLVERVSAIGGTEAAAVASSPPLGGGIMRSVIPEGSTDAKDRGILTRNNSVSPGYFKTMNIALVRGRDFNDFDTADKPAVAIINESTQKRFWPNDDPVGKRFNFITEPFMIEVVGVVKDTLSQLGQPPQPIVYLPFGQRFAGGSALIVRTRQDPAMLLTDIQNAIRSLDRNVPVTDVRTMRQALADALQGPRMGAALLGIFGVMALVLAAVGIYGVMSFSVSQRTQELGIRIALGARSGDVRGLVLRQGMALVGFGLAAGLFLAWAASLAVRSLLFGVSNLDPAAYALNVLLLVAVAYAACAIPARRATRVDPIIALRYE